MHDKVVNRKIFVNNFHDFFSEKKNFKALFEIYSEINNLHYKWIRKPLKGIKSKIMMMMMGRKWKMRRKYARCYYVSDLETQTPRCHCECLILFLFYSFFFLSVPLSNRTILRSPLPSAETSAIKLKLWYKLHNDFILTLIASLGNLIYGKKYSRFNISTRHLLWQTSTHLVANPMTASPWLSDRDYAKTLQRSSLHTAVACSAACCVPADASNDPHTL